MSNLEELAKATGIINDSNQAAIALAGALIGTIADFAGGVGAVVSAVQLVASLFGGGDQTRALLQNILDTIKQEFDRLHLELKAEDIQAQLRDLDAAIAQAEAVFAQLPATVSAQPPVDENEILDQIRTCLAAVILLANDDKWKSVHDDQVYFPQPIVSYYKGGGLPSAVFPVQVNPSTLPPSMLSTAFTFQGLTFVYSFDPGPEADGRVFSYTYVLPLYLRAVMIFLAVGAALDPKFVTNYRDAVPGGLRDIAQTLLTRHDQIAAGIVNIAAPNQDDITAEVWTSGTEGLGTPYYPWSLGLLWDEVELIYPYGAVDLFSGYSAVAAGPPTPDANPPWDDDSFLKMFSKYLLRTLARSKDVYRGIGLPEVRATINRLRTLAGDAPLAGLNFGDWSLREVFSFLGYPENTLIAPPISLAPLTARNLTAYLESSPPTFVATPPISLRQILEGQLPPDSPNYFGPFMPRDPSYP